MFCRRFVYLLPNQARNVSNQTNPRQQELMARGLPKRTPIPGVDHVVIVASGKGGVGKSTKAANLAVMLASMGKKVGILDADVFGPTIPLMMNLHMAPLLDENSLMIPPINYAVKCMSMGLLVSSEPMIWRGPLVMSALHRLLRGTVWGPLDVLIVDTPPGTGDVHLSLAQNVPIDGVLLVSTPQAAALQVTVRGAEMFKKLNIPIIGLIENMRNAVCPNCGSNVEIFKNITETYAKKIGCEVLASIPIDIAVSDCSDQGTPLVAKAPDSQYAKSFRSLAESLMEFLNTNKQRNEGTKVTTQAAN